MPSFRNWLGQWPEALILVTGTVTTLAALTCELPAQNVMLAGGLVALGALCLESLNTVTGAPFGNIIFHPQAGPMLFHILPWWLTVFWMLVLLNARGVARFLLAPARKSPNYGFYVLGLTTLMVMTFAMTFQPYAIQIGHYWSWSSQPFSGVLVQAPVTELLSRGAATLVTMALVTPILINKKATPERPFSFPLVFWLLLLSYFLTATGVNRLWPVFGITLVHFVVLAALGLRRLRLEQT